ncbi:NUDIX domain-containing protein [Actinoallomurus purpureus]|uniref:NUDIX domain-containing protein n=1 Tax=Actinoallomurus purpureus TaxID=478114 RepID=UPI00209339E1|nr:NUDIX domain-containing protein [Actinoallomurus purpureus]MCO6010297.1 NUDIX domain-containing protein [Actinoallomurus purpureus]
MITAPGIDPTRLTYDAGRDGIAKLVVGAVVHTGGKVLVLRRSAIDDFLPGIEELPSGGVEAGEDLLTALARELAEEIGRTGPMTLDSGFVANFDYLSGSGHKTRQLTFGLPHDGRPIALSTEHTTYRWLRPADLAESSVTEETAQTIRSWAVS